MFQSLSERVRKAIEIAPSGIATLDVLDSLHLCGADTLKTTLNRLNKKGAIAGLKRGTYASLPLQDGFAAAQATFNGYLGFSSALYLHKITAEQPFTITIVTTATSASKTFGQYEFKAVALKEKAVGFQYEGALAVSTRGKTLFDCIYLPRYSIEHEKLVEAFGNARLSENEWNGFDGYVKRFATGKMAVRMREAKREIRGWRK
ncbi:hypothetical protein HY995_01160 [Candidatus Micrarchaeota archaeon]|nr:hypothetical protein [Candidatus Micrarchaeota archaeon]